MNEIRLPLLLHFCLQGGVIVWVLHFKVIFSEVIQECQNVVISFLFQGIVATIKKKEYNFLDQRQADFDQDYEDFCKHTDDLHVGSTGPCLFFPLCDLLLIITHLEGTGIFMMATSACIL